MKKLILLLLLTVSIQAASLKGNVNPLSAFIVSAQLEMDAKNSPNDPITLNLDSGGGSVFAGFDIIRTMRKLQAKGHKIHAYVRGYCASMCFTILQAADVRIMEPLGMIMQHDISDGNARSRAVLENSIRILEAKRIGIDLIDWVKLSKGEIYFSPEEALKLNIIDQIGY